MADLYAGVDRDGREIIIPAETSDQLWERSRSLRTASEHHAMVACRLILSGHADTAAEDARLAVQLEAESLAVARESLGGAS